MDLEQTLTHAKLVIRIHNQPLTFSLHPLSQKPMAISLFRSILGQSPARSNTNPTGIEFWTDPERAGWLAKHGEHIKTWRHRWFVLKQGKLFWFKSSAVDRSSRPRGAISVADCVSVKGADDVLNHRCAFELATRDEIMYFVADSEAEKENWIKSIGRAIVQSSNSVTDGEIVDYDCAEK